LWFADPFPLAEGVFVSVSFVEWGRRRDMLLLGEFNLRTSSNGDTTMGKDVWNILQDDTLVVRRGENGEKRLVNEGG